ncbi:MAG: AI-2E family transporter [Flavisolibacter sp.]
MPFIIVISQIILGLWALFYILYVGQAIILPLIYALILAILLNPLVNFLCGKGLNRVWAITITLLFAIIFLSVVIYFLGSESARFSETFPALQQKFNVMLKDGTDWVSDKFGIEHHKIDDWIEKMRTESINLSGSVIGKTLLTVTAVLTLVFLLPVYIFMFLFYKPLLLEFIARLFRKSNQDTVAEVLMETKRLIQSYLVGLAVEALIIAILNSVGLLILGIQYAFLLGIIGAIVNVIPWIGGLISIALPVIVALATKSPAYALWVVAIYVVIQFVDNHFLIPKIVASRVKINALVSLVVVFVGGELWGVPGMFLSIPLTALIKVVFDRMESLEPFGFLLGDNMPPPGKSVFKFRSRKSTKK